MIRFVTPLEITTYTPLGGNIDQNKYNFCIDDVQNSLLREMLGDTLYNKIETYLDNDALAGDYLLMFDQFIKPYVIHKSAAEYIKIASFLVSNGGIFKHNPANGEAVSLEEVNFLANTQDNKAEMYQTRLENWLSLNNITEYVYNQENVVNPVKETFNSNFDIV